MNDFDKLLKVVAAEAKAAGVPISSKVVPHVAVNTRAKKRFGQCILTNGIYTIELSGRLLDAPEKSCRQTIAHELIHTCRGCGNHGKSFQKYAAVMNRMYGYSIKTTNSCEEMGIAEEQSVSAAKYIIQCQSCGALIKRIRYSNAVADPSKYRCRCGGKLKRIK